MASVLRRRAVALLAVPVFAVLPGFALSIGGPPGLGHAVSLLAAGDLPALRDGIRGFGVGAPLASAVLMQVQAVIAPLPSLPLMYANGVLFGTLWGGLLSWVSILASAVLCFGLARRFGRPLVEHVVSPAALARADRLVTCHGAFGIFVVRLLPLTAFDLTSYAAGLTRLPLGPFRVATALGMTPAIFLIAAAGDLGLDSPWWFGGDVVVMAAAAALTWWLRPSALRWLARRADTGPVRGGARSTPPDAVAGRGGTGVRATSRPAG